MSFGIFFSLYEVSKPFDEEAYKRHVEAGKSLASAVEQEAQKYSTGPIPDRLGRAIVETGLVGAIDDPLGVLKYLAMYLAVKGDLWAAGRLHATHKAEMARRDAQRETRRSGARQTNAGKNIERTRWLALAGEVGRKIRATEPGARLSDTALAKKIVASREFGSLGVRRPSWNTVRGALAALRLEGIRRSRSPTGNARADRKRVVSRRASKLKRQ